MSFWKGIETRKPVVIVNVNIGSEGVGVVLDLLCSSFDEEVLQYGAVMSVLDLQYDWVWLSFHLDFFLRDSDRVPFVFVEVLIPLSDFPNFFLVDVRIVRV